MLEEQNHLWNFPTELPLCCQVWVWHHARRVPISRGQRAGQLQGAVCTKAACLHTGERCFVHYTFVFSYKWPEGRVLWFQYFLVEEVMVKWGAHGKVFIESFRLGCSCWQWTVFNPQTSQFHMGQPNVDRCCGILHKHFTRKTSPLLFAWLGEGDSKGGRGMDECWNFEWRTAIWCLFREEPWFWRASLVAQTVKNPSAMQETWVWFLGQEDSLDKEWQPTPVFLPREFHGQKSLVGHSPWVTQSWTRLSD